MCFHELRLKFVEYSFLRGASDNATQRIQVIPIITSYVSNFNSEVCLSNNINISVHFIIAVTHGI